MLKNVLLSVSSTAVELVGTDQEMGIRCVVSGVSTVSAGEALLPTSRLSSILRELQDETFTLEIEDRNILSAPIHQSSASSSEDPAEFPPVPTFTEWDFFRIPAAVFRTMIR
ncbi:MAG UNVERIFIED_CONTAM: DNA polymerase III subunit beta, partial [Planctomycetaceae bacterium]